MDPHANLKDQLAAAVDIVSLVGTYTSQDGELPSDIAQQVADRADELAELVLALHDWRRKGGFDPYPAEDLHREIRDALTGDSNDAEHNALVSVAAHFGIEYELEDEEEERVAECPVMVGMAVDEARCALRAGKRIRIVVGAADDDPTIVLSLNDGTVMCEAVAGWSAGVVEPMCAIGSDYLRTALQDRHSIEVVEPIHS